MKNKFKLISFLFLVCGIGIIVAAYFLFLKEHQEEKLFYLNLVATTLVFTIFYLRTFDIFGSVSHVAEQGAGYGLKWYGVWLYVPAALALVSLSIILKWDFNPCLIGHLVLLFMLLSFYFVGSVTQNNVNEVVNQIERRKSGLKEISTLIDALDMQCRMKNLIEYQDYVNTLRENVRFITASDSQTAVEMEEKLAKKIRLITSQIENNSQPADVVNAGFKECITIIELRKKQY